MQDGVSEDHGWWVRIGDESRWVPDTETLRRWVAEGRVVRTDMICDARSTSWVVATEVIELRPQLYPVSIGPYSRWRFDMFLATLPLLAILLTGAGVAVIVGSVRDGLADAFAARSWGAIDGRITHSAVATRDELMVSGTTLHWHRPDIRYEYQVANQRYDASRIDFRPATHNETLDRVSAETIVARYPVGARVPVFVNPADPQSASLDRGDDPIIRAVLGLMLSAGGIVLFFGWWWRRRAVRAFRPPQLGLPN